MNGIIDYIAYGNGVWCIFQISKEILANLLTNILPLATGLYSLISALGWRREMNRRRKEGEEDSERGMEERGGNERERRRGREGRRGGGRAGERKRDDLDPLF